MTSNKSCESFDATFIMKPTNRQQESVEHNGRNLQLTACADDGNTEGVAQRVVRPLTPGRMDSLLPSNIVAITITQKEADLKENIITCARRALRAVTVLAQFRKGSWSGQHAGEGTGLEPGAQDLARRHCRRLQLHRPRNRRDPGMRGVSEPDHTDAPNHRGTRRRHARVPAR